MSEYPPGSLEDREVLAKMPIGKTFGLFLLAD